jgi:cytosine/adenosine deaminase-related metal-dependent hydrolase
MRLFLVVGWLCLNIAANAQDYDLVIKHGRVMDPETQLDGVREIGISDGVIKIISTQPLSGHDTIDARGLVVAPGFIDLHAHGQDQRSSRFQVADGVTTALELEIGVLPVAAWLKTRAGKSRTHYGATAGHLSARMKTTAGIDVLNPIYSGLDSSAADVPDYANVTLSAVQQAELVERVEQGIQQGGLGIGIGITYAPGASHAEILAMFELAARYQVPVFYIRQARYMGGDLLAPLQEVIADAAVTGAALHVVHINSSLDEDARMGMSMIRGARANGVDVTTEAYPYTAGSTRLESALFENYQGDFSQLQWTATGERLNRESFEEYRKEGGWVIIHGRSEITNTWLVAQPDIMVASDGVPFVGDFSHPRSAGTYARVLGNYVRDEQALTLMVALQKMTLDPARRLETFAPSMAGKGRVQVGVDADLTIFNPQTVLDQATYSIPARTSLGIVHVLVGGEAVIADSELVEDVFPGQAVRAEFSQEKEGGR